MDVRSYVSMVENGHLGEFVYFAGSQLLMNYHKYEWGRMSLNVSEIKKRLDGTKQGLREAVKLAVMMGDRKQFMECASLREKYQYERSLYKERCWHNDMFKGDFIETCDVRGVYDDMKKVVEKDGIVIDDSLMMEEQLNAGDWAFYREKFRAAFSAALFCLEEEYKGYVIMALGWLGKMCNISEQVYGKR